MIELPKYAGEKLYVEAHGLRLQVKKLKPGEYFLLIDGQQQGRFGNAEQAREDIQYFLEGGALPRSKQMWTNARRTDWRLTAKVVVHNGPPWGAKVYDSAGHLRSYVNGYATRDHTEKEYVERWIKEYFPEAQVEYEQTPNPRAEWVQTDEERTDSKGRRVILFQKGRTFRWLNEDGKALSPVQKNIAEALAYAEWVGWRGAVPQYQRPRSTAHDVMQAAFEILTRFPERALFHRPESGKVFIADVLGLLPDLTKEDLHRMNQRGEIRLARIDLTSALDAEEFQRMKASEIQHGSTDSASFHVVIAR